MNSDNNNQKDILKKKREFILENLKNLRNLEYPNEEGICFRYLKMTVQEANERKDYCFHVLFHNGSTHKKHDLRYGFVYDFRHLLNESFFRMDNEVCYLPIVLKTETWDTFISKNKNKEGIINPILYDVIKLDQPGIIKFPLYKEESLNIFNNYYGKSYIFILDKTASDLQMMRLENTNYTTSHVFFDDSETHRIYPPKLSENRDLADIQKGEQDNAFIQEQISTLKKFLLDEFKDLAILNGDKFLNSVEVNKKMWQMFLNGADSTLVFGTILNQALQDTISVNSILKKQKGKNGDKEKKVLFHDVDEDQ
jgi:hypothetical protein